MKPPKNYPALQLCFSADEKTPFLLEGLFYKAAGSAPIDLCANLKQRKPLRALCVMLLLAKHQGGKILDEHGRIRFNSKLETANWVHSLGAIRDTEWTKIRNKFRETYVLDRSRGTTHTTSNDGQRRKKTSEVFYQPSLLPPENLEFYKRSRTAPDGTLAKEIAAKDLVDFAMTLEQYEVERYVPGTIKGWQPCVKEIVENFRKERSWSPSGSEEAQADKLVFMTANWEDFFTFADKAVGAEIKEHFRSPGIGDDWYVICVTPAWLIDWKRIFRDALQHSRVNLKWAQHAPTAAAECRSVKSQWEMIYGFDYPKATVVREVEGILTRSIDDFKPWHDGTPAARKGGSFELWQSSVAHYFMGVMSVPKGQKARDGKAPKGTICLVQPFPMYPVDRTSRCGFCLKWPSPMLDVYYHSFLRFFEQGKADGHLTKMDFDKPRPKRA